MLNTKGFIISHLAPREGAWVAQPRLAGRNEESGGFRAALVAM